MADSEQKDGKRVERNVVEIDIGSGRKLEIKTTVETGPPEAFGFTRSRHYKHRWPEIAKSWVSSITYFLVVALIFSKNSLMYTSTGDLIVKVLTGLLFLYAGIVCLIGPRAVFTLDNSEDILVDGVRAMGLIGLLPMILFVRSLL